MSAMKVIGGGSAWYRSNPADKLGRIANISRKRFYPHWVDVYANPCTIHILAIDLQQETQ